MAFLDEEEALAPPGGGEPPHRYVPERQRQILVRRAIAVGVIVLLLILIVLGIKGCLNARKQRSFENYASDLSSIAAQSKQLSDDLFGRLTNPGNLTPLSFKAEIASDRGTAEGLATRVESLDTPDELKGAQNELNIAFQLRRDALTGISDQISTALGTEGRGEAVNRITDYMQYFLASDVLYRRAQALIDAELQDQDIDEKAPASVFLPEPITDWLDPLEVSSKLAGVAGTKQATAGVHGLGLLQTTVAGTVLSTDTTTTISKATELDVDVQNQGDSEESDVTVSAQVTGGTQTISGEATIPKIGPGETQTAKIALDSAPPTGQQLTIDVTVQPVIGEQVETNNKATYQVTFQ